MLGLDTLSFGKLTILLEKGYKNLIIEILDKYDFFITYEVQKEIIHHLPTYSELLKKLKIFPKLNVKTQDYVDLGFDLADATMLEYSEKEGYVVITEDEKMLAEGITEKNNIIQLIDFFTGLYETKFLERKELYHITKYFQKIRNISEKKEKKILQKL